MHMFSLVSTKHTNPNICGQDSVCCILQLPQYKMDHNHVLEHSLHQLLRENHFKNINFPAPHPVTALVGLTKRRRLAGPHALSRKQLLDMSERSGNKRTCLKLPLLNLIGQHNLCSSIHTKWEECVKTQCPQNDKVLLKKQINPPFMTLTY